MHVMTALDTTAPSGAVPDGHLVYAIGDIHGRLDLLDRLLAMIADDAAPRRADRISVVFLGDIIDRGPWSRQVVERLMGGPPASGPLAGAQWVCLRGNHEDALVRFITQAATDPGWRDHGGIETVESYGGEITASIRHDLAALQLLMSRLLPPSHLRFLSRLPVRHDIGDYVFVHAGVRPGVALDEQAPHDMMWIRRDFLDDSRPHGRIVVHGHTPRPTPDIRANRIGIDTRAYDSGILTALGLWRTDHWFLST